MKNCECCKKELEVSFGCSHYCCNCAIHINKKNSEISSIRIKCKELQFKLNKLKDYLPILEAIESDNKILKLIKIKMSK